MDRLKKTTRAIIGLFTGSQPSKPHISTLKPVVPLQSYLSKAYKDALLAHKLGAQPDDDSAGNLHVPISVFVHVRTGSNHYYAGIHDDEVHFSASLLKVAAMFAAFSLREEARQLAPGGGFADENAFFAALSLQFTSADAVPAIRNAGVGLKPRYKDVLKLTGFGAGPLQVEFNPTFSVPLAVDHALYATYRTVRAHELSLGHIFDDKEPRENAATITELNKVSHMYKMIVPSNNASAAECIRRLGYAYINVKLMNSGFYDPNSSPPKGIWLAADFAGGPRVEIDSVNDGKSAQATTSRQMARFFSLIDLGQLIDAPSSATTNSAEMKALLKEAHGVDSAWISRFPPRLYDFEGVKVGLANLKPNTPPKGPDVYSEGVLLKWNNASQVDSFNASQVDSFNAKMDPTNSNPGVRLSGQIAVCWQNVRVSAFNTGVRGIADMIQTAFSNFLNQSPP